MAPGGFDRFGLGTFWRSLATDTDRNGLEFVSLIEVTTTVHIPPPNLYGSSL